ARVDFPGHRREKTRSSSADVLRLRALLALGHVVLDLLPFVQLAVAGARDCRVVHENVGASIVLLDEAEAPFRGEPFYRTASHYVFLLRTRQDCRHRLPAKLLLPVSTLRQQLPGSITRSGQRGSDDCGSGRITPATSAATPSRTATEASARTTVTWSPRKP